VVKNKLAPPFRVCEFDIMFGEGISREGDILDLGVELNLVNKSGSWYSYNEMKIGQGRENAKKYFKENPHFLRELENNIRKSYELAELPPIETKLKEELPKKEALKSSKEKVKPLEIPVEELLIE
ncbi:MAG: DNA recombination/repair protein RecA, partial [Defluviitaleaceae bacterium]|nr:DNA recombination/repair protein RecA [Defluviitaleaceae bacterium]